MRKMIIRIITIKAMLPQTIPAMAPPDKPSKKSVVNV